MRSVFLVVQTRSHQGVWPCGQIQSYLESWIWVKAPWLFTNSGLWTWHSKASLEFEAALGLHGGDRWCRNILNKINKFEGERKPGFIGRVLALLPVKSIVRFSKRSFWGGRETTYIDTKISGYCNFFCCSFLTICRMVVLHHGWTLGVLLLFSVPLVCSFVILQAYAEKRNANWRWIGKWKSSFSS